MAGRKFRRQHRIGPYIVDFYCAGAKLVIELDGGQHLDRQAYDFHRTRFLQAQGCRVIRFWNHDVLLQTDAVLEAILVALEDQPLTPALSPFTGRGSKATEIFPSPACGEMTCPQLPYQ